MKIDQKMAELINPKNYPSFTLFYQAIGSIRIIFNVLWRMPCDILVDTSGVVFAYPIAKLFYPIKLFSYTHYPLISNDMLETVKNAEA